MTREEMQMHIEKQKLLLEEKVLLYLLFRLKRKSRMMSARRKRQNKSVNKSEKRRSVRRNSFNKS